MTAGAIIAYEAKMIADRQPHHEGTAATADRTDHELINDCLAGNTAALTTLVERHQAVVFGTCLRLVRDADAAAELANTVFYKAYQHLASVDAERPLRPWLLRIATNESLNFVRARGRQQRQIVTGDETDQLVEAVPGPDNTVDSVLGAERRAAVRAAVAALPEQYRLLIVLRFFDDLSYNEIAQQTGQSVNTVGVQLLRARQALRRILAGQEVDDDPS